MPVARQQQPGAPWWARIDWPRSSYYWWYFSVLGALVPYWPLYLEARGFGPRALGELMGVLAVTRVIAPQAGGFLSDHWGHRTAIVRVAAGLALLVFLAMTAARGFLAVALVMAGFSFFWYATLPPLEASTLARHGDRYGRVRLWGSVGFIVMVLALGPLWDRFGSAVLVPVIALALLALWFSTLALPPLAARPEPRAPFRVRPGLWPFLAACFLMQVSFGPYYTFYSVYLSHYGYDKTAIGALWALGVVCEILVFWQAPRLFARFRDHALFAWTFALAILRWILIAQAPRSGLVLLLAQILHAFTFGLYHAVAIRLAGGFTGAGMRARAQALYGSAAGAGAALGAVASGQLWPLVGGQATFLWAAAVAALALAVVILWVPRQVAASG